MRPTIFPLVLASVLTFLAIGGCLSKSDLDRESALEVLQKHHESNPSETVASFDLQASWPISEQQFNDLFSWFDEVQREGIGTVEWQEGTNSFTRRRLTDDGWKTGLDAPRQRGFQHQHSGGGLRASRDHDWSWRIVISESHQNLVREDKFVTRISVPIEVTGISFLGDSKTQALVTYVQKFELTPFGRVKPAPYNSLGPAPKKAEETSEEKTAILQLFDDGWRVVE